MILFALTSDIKQSTDYADLDSLLYGISNGDKKCCIRLRTHLFTVLPFRF